MSHRDELITEVRALLAIISESPYAPGVREALHRAKRELDDLDADEQD